MSMRHVTATATRNGDWWAVEVPEIPGLFTQARRLDQIEAMVKDAATILGQHVDTVSVEPQLNDDERASVDRLMRAREQAHRSQAEASTLTRETIRLLRAKGLTVRDVADVVGLTPQRVSVLQHS